jgi:hypothetical protein
LVFRFSDPQVQQVAELWVAAEGLVPARRADYSTVCHCLAGRQALHPCQVFAANDAEHHKPPWSHGTPSQVSTTSYTCKKKKKKKKENVYIGVL